MQADVAIVDDEPVLCEVLTEILGGEGYTARGFVSAGACLEAMGAGFRPRLVFVDLRMRGLSGAEFVQRVRAASWGGGVAIYVVSGSMQEEDYPPSTFIQGSINKPFHIEDILRIAAEHVGEARPGLVTA